MGPGFSKSSINYKVYLENISSNLNEKTHFSNYCSMFLRPKILELGLGSPNIIKYFLSNNKNFTGEILGIDSDRHIVNFARSSISDSRVKFMFCNIAKCKSNLLWQKFDIVNLSSVIHEIYTYQNKTQGVIAAIKNISLMQQKGGILLVRDPKKDENNCKIKLTPKTALAEAFLLKFFKINQIPYSIIPNSQSIVLSSAFSQEIERHFITFSKDAKIITINNSSVEEENLIQKKFVSNAKIIRQYYDNEAKEIYYPYKLQEFINLLKEYVPEYSLQNYFTYKRDAYKYFLNKHFEKQNLASHLKNEFVTEKMQLVFIKQG